MESKMQPMKGSSHRNEYVGGGSRAATAPPPFSSGAAACSLCGRTFASVKAVHGHMRSHTEKERRRRAQSTASPVEKPGNLQVECYSSRPSSSVRSWFNTRTRGGKAMAAPPNQVQSPDAQNSAAAIDEDQPHVLESSACDSSPRDPKTKAMALLEVGKGESNAASDAELSSEISTNAINAGLEGTDLARHCGQKDEALGARTCDCDCCKRWCSSSPQQKRKPEDAAAVAGGTGHACSMCGRFFPSFQALGGHMASHGKQRVEDSVVGSGDGAGCAEAAGSSKAKRRRRLEASPAEHRCNICDRVYPTGQALGGHKRLHWEGPKKPPPPGGTAAPSTGGDLQRASSRVWDFDLNEPPRDEDGKQ